MGERYLSVDVARLTTPEESFRRRVDEQRLGELAASVPLAHGLDVRPEPLEDNIAHTGIYGLDTEPGILVRHLLAQATRVIR